MDDLSACIFSEGEKQPEINPAVKRLVVTERDKNELLADVLNRNKEDGFTDGTPGIH